MRKSDTRPKIVVSGVLKYIIIGILLCAVACGAGFVFGSASKDKAQEELSAVVLQERIAAMSQLATVTYSYTNMAKYESGKEFYGVHVPFTTNGFILTYDGEIKAGINMSKVGVKVNGTNVEVTMPEAEILSHEIDEESVEIFDEKTSIFNPFTVKDYTDFYADQKKEMEAKAGEKGILKEAEKQAKSSIEAMFKSVLPEEYVISWKEQA